MVVKAGRRLPFLLLQERFPGSLRPTMPRNRVEELFDTQIDEARSRSRSPVSAQGAGTLTDTEQTKFSSYIKEVAKDIPEEIRNKIQKAMQQYTKDTKQLLKFKEWLRSDLMDMDAIKSN
ncbi:MAG: hypothetical protein ACKPKO_34475 [Candidatus Fonsibacter sp.]